MSATNSLLSPARIIIRDYNHQLGKVSDYDSVGQLYFLGRIQGFESETILPWLWIGTTTKDQLPYFETIYNLLLPNGKESDLVSQNKNARTQLGEVNCRLSQ